MQQGLVVAAHGANLWVEDDTGKRRLCRNHPRQPRPVCGDRIEWRPDGASAGHVVRILPRRSELRRPARRGGHRVLAANVDLMVVTIAPRPAPDPFLVDRYLVAARLLGMDAAVFMNKADLLDDTTRSEAQSLLAEFANLGYTTGLCTCHKNQGLAPLRECLAGRTGILVGQSGVGKSSLVRELVPDSDARIGELSAASGEGRHTTTTASLYHLPGGGDLIDSPGVRDFRLWPVDARELSRGFVEFADLPPCRFTDCSHRQEPGCNVIAAVAEARISQRRYRSYLRILSQPAAEAAGGAA